MRISIEVFAALMTVASSAPLAQTQQYKPEGRFIFQPVRLIVPNAPGGPTDTVARVVGQKLAERLGVAVIVDNRPGASGTVGGDIVAKSAPDGRTLLLASSSAFVSTPILFPTAPYDGRRDFALITGLVWLPYLLLVNPAKGPASVRDFIALAKAKPGALNYGSAGTGTTSHLVGAMFAAAAGIEVAHIPYKGSSLAAIDLMGGQLQFEFEATAGSMPHVLSGRLRALGITSAKRVSFLPEVPTIAESGVSGFEASITHGIAATAKTPAALVARLNREIVATLSSPDTRERLIAVGGEIVGNSPAEYLAATRAEMRRWEKVVRDIAAKGQ